MKDRYVKFVGDRILVVGEHRDTSDCTKISVADADWQAAGSPSWWVNDSGTIRKPTQAEKDARVEAMAQASIAKMHHDLYLACYGYEELNIDRNLDRLIYRAQDLIKFNGATEANFPTIKALGDWKQSLWGNGFDYKVQTEIDAAPVNLNGSYYERLAYLYQNGTLPAEAFDFGKDFDPCPHNFRQANAEMLAYNP